MKRIYSLFTLNYLFQRTERLFNGITVILLSVAASLMTVYLLSQMHSPLFRISQVGQRNLTILLPAHEKSEIAPNVREAIATVMQSGYEVDYDWLLQTTNTTETGEKRPFFIRLVDNDLLQDDIILSVQAAHKLGVRSGDYVFVDAINKKVRVKSIEAPITNYNDAILHGYITLSYQYLPLLSIGLGVDEPLSLMIMSVGVRRTDMTANEQGLLDCVIESAVQNGYAVIPQSNNDYASVTVDMTENTLLLLAILSALISMLGVLGLLYIKQIRLTKKYAILRTYGMTMHQAMLFSLSDTTIFAIVSSLFGMLLGSFLFAYNAALLLGLEIKYTTIICQYGLTCFLLSVVLVLPLMLSCNIWMYKRIFNTEIISIFQKRKTSIRKRKEIFWIVIGLVLYAISAYLITRNTQVINYVFIAITSVVIFYVIFQIPFTFLRKQKQKTKNISTLSFTLLSNRKGFTAMIGTSIVVMVVMSITIYNVVVGVDSFVEKLWIRLNGYNTVLVVSGENYEALCRDLVGEEITYYTAYVKEIEFSNPDVNRTYRIALLRDDLGVVPGLIPPMGEYYANRYFLAIEFGMRRIDEFTYRRGIKYSFRKDSHGFEKTLKLYGEVKDQLDNPASYTVAVNYLEVGDNVPDSYKICIVMGVTQKERLIVNNIATYYNSEIYTSEAIVQEYKDSLQNFFMYIFITCALLVVTSVVFLFAICCAMLFTRKREFILYRVFGASKRTLCYIVAFECVYVTLVAILISTLLNFGGINLFSGVLANTFAYSFSVVMILLTASCVLALVLITAYLSLSYVRPGVAKDILRIN